MAVEYVRRTAGASLSSSPTYTLTLSSPSTPGNALLVFVIARFATNFPGYPEFMITDTGGNTFNNVYTEVPTPLYSNSIINVLVGQVDSSASSITISSDGRNISPTIVIYEVSGLDTSDPIEQIQSAYGASNNISSLSLSTPNANVADPTLALAFGILANSSAENTFTFNTGYASSPIAIKGILQVSSTYKEDSSEFSSVTVNKSYNFSRMGAVLLTLKEGSSGSVLTNLQTASAVIEKNAEKTQSASARVTKTNTKTQFSTARIQQATEATTTQEAISRIALNSSTTQASKSRVSSVRTSTQPTIARVSYANTSTQNATATIANSFTKVQSANAAIALTKSVSQTSTASIVVNTTNTRDQIASSAISNTRTTTQTQVARILTTPERVQTAKAQISAPIVITQEAIGRIANVGTLFQVSTARVNPTFEGTLEQTATAKILQTNIYTETQDATARIQRILTGTQSLKARIAITKAFTQGSVSRMANVISRSQLATASIVVNGIGSKTQTASARIIGTGTNSQLAISRITTTGSLAVPSIARISATKELEQSATARIVVNVSGHKDQDAIARLATTFTKTQPVSATVTKTFTTTQSAVSRLSSAYTASQEATAAIVETILSPYTYGVYNSLPNDNSPLTNAYSQGQIEDVSVVDGVFVTATGTGKYLIHQFVTEAPLVTAKIRPEWVGKIGKPAIIGATPVVMQIYNLVSEQWETLTTNTTSPGGSVITLNGSVLTNLEDYYDSSLYCYVRIYQ